MRTLWHGFSRRRRLSDSREAGKSTPAMLTVLSRQCGITKTGGTRARIPQKWTPVLRPEYAQEKLLIVTTLEGANGRQEQRSCRDLANHDRRDGEGIQFLRQSGDGLSGIQQGRQSGRRGFGGRAKA